MQRIATQSNSKLSNSELPCRSGTIFSEQQANFQNTHKEKKINVKTRYGKLPRRTRKDPLLQRTCPDPYKQPHRYQSLSPICFFLVYLLLLLIWIHRFYFLLVANTRRAKGNGYLPCRPNAGSFPHHNAARQQRERHQTALEISKADDAKTKGRRLQTLLDGAEPLSVLITRSHLESNRHVPDLNANALLVQRCVLFFFYEDGSILA